MVIICSVHSKMASNTRGTSGAMSSRSFVMMAANRLSTSASLRTEPHSSLCTVGCATCFVSHGVLP